VPSSRVCRVVETDPQTLWARLADFPRWSDWLLRLASSRMDPAGPTHSPGATRIVGDPQQPIVHEILMAVDAGARTLSYGVASEPVWPVPARQYVATVRLIPLTDRRATVVEWSSRYDCDRRDEEQIDTVLQGLYEGFIDNLAS
jgi:hypothetical protein